MINFILNLVSINSKYPFTYYFLVSGFNSDKHFLFKKKMEKKQFINNFEVQNNAAINKICQTFLYS